MAKYRWSLWASSDYPSWGTSFRCTSSKRSPSRPGVPVPAAAWPGVEGSPLPARALSVAPSPWWLKWVANGAAALTSPGAPAGAAGWGVPCRPPAEAPAPQPPSGNGDPVAP